MTKPDAVKAARERVLEAYEDSGKSPSFETDDAYDAAFLGALDAYAVAIRADERSKESVLPLLQGGGHPEEWIQPQVQPDAELYGWLNHAWSVLGKLSRNEDVPPEEIQQSRLDVQRAKLRISGQNESALRAAARGAAQLAEDVAAHIDDVGGSGGDTVRTIADLLHAALDGAPTKRSDYEPSEAEVERGLREGTDRMGLSNLSSHDVRAVLKAAWGREM